MIKMQQFTVAIVLIVLINFMGIIGLTAMLCVDALQQQLPLPINWLPNNVSQSSEADNAVAQNNELNEVVSDLDVSTVQCAICIEYFKVKDTLSIFSQCCHGFHIGCIIPWLAQSKVCPSCQQLASDMRILVLTKAEDKKPNSIIQGEKLFLGMLARLGNWGHPLIYYFHSLSLKEKTFYSIMSVLGIVLVAYLAYKWWTSSSSDAGGSCSGDTAPELIELATSYQSKV